MTIFYSPTFDRERMEMGRMLESGMHGYGLRVYRGQKGAGIGTAAATAASGFGKKVLVPLVKHVGKEFVIPAAKRAAAHVGRKALAFANKKFKKGVGKANRKANKYLNSFAKGSAEKKAIANFGKQMLGTANKAAAYGVKRANKRAGSYLDALDAPKRKKRRPTRPGRKGLPPIWR